MKGKETYLD